MKQKAPTRHVADRRRQRSLGVGDKGHARAIGKLLFLRPARSREVRQARGQNAYSMVAQLGKRCRHAVQLQDPSRAIEAMGQLAGPLTNHVARPLVRPNGNVGLASPEIDHVVVDDKLNQDIRPRPSANCARTGPRKLAKLSEAETRRGAGNRWL